LSARFASRYLETFSSDPESGEENFVETFFKRSCTMPNVVVGDPKQREARISGNTIPERYLGVLVADAPDEIPPGGTAEIRFRLMYWPDEKYEQLVPGTTFTLREGPKIVGFGQVLSDDR
jgi:hypothetical protein